MTSLDMPQHVYACSICAATAFGAGCMWDDHEDAPVVIEPTLTYADFQVHMATLEHPQPDAYEVWDIIEREVDTSATNGDAIKRAVAKWHGRRIHAIGHASVGVSGARDWL